MEIEIKEQKVQVLKRVPPGDRWVFANGKNSAVYPSLTDALESCIKQMVIHNSIWMLVEG